MGLDDSIRDSESLTKERHHRQHRVRKKPYGATPQFVAVTADGGLLQLLIDFLESLPEEFKPPDELNERLGGIPDGIPHVALAILAPILDTIARGWDGPPSFHDPWAVQLAEKMGGLLCHWLAMKEAEMAEAGQAKLTGRRLIPGKKRPGPTHKFKHPDWTSSECAVAGDWMLAVALSLPCFGEDEHGRPCIATAWQEHIDKICEHLEYRHPVMLPHRSPPKPWTGWWSNYSDRLRAPFVRDWRPETRPAIEATFAAAKDVAKAPPPMDDLEVQRMVDAMRANDAGRQQPRLPAEPSGQFAKLAVLKYSLPFAHADGVNALKRVPLRINQDLLPLIDKFAVSMMRDDVKKLVVDSRGSLTGRRRASTRLGCVVVIGPDDEKLKADRRTVKADLRHARWCGDGTIYLDYNCDKRGRLNAIQHLNYAREDHVRALFEFARGKSLAADGVGGTEAMTWLEIHAANCCGEDKKLWRDRISWAKQNTDLIERVAADPQNNYDLWRKGKADKPFAFVAACIELSRARKNPTGFETHLPIGFDGTANGLQHLALLARDEDAARLVNLIDSDIPQDIYLAVTRRVMKLLKGEDDRLFSKRKGWVYDRGERGFEALDRDRNSIGFSPDKESALAAVKRLPKPEGKSVRDAWCFDFWHNRLSELDEKQKRKLFKKPIMTFPYSSTVGGMADEMVDIYSDLFELNEPEDDAAIFLAKAVRLACEDILPGPTLIMRYIRKLALHRYNEEEFLEWRSLSGFPFVNMYHYPNIVPLDLCFGIRSRYKVADGASPKRKKEKMLNAASPNFIHSLDAAHLILTVLAANREGIRDILTVHDSYSCLAPFARHFGQIIRREMAMLHVLDPLRALSKANGDPKPLPERGNLDPLALQKGEYSFM
jgi:hypothetical protein